jgi:hypothetical protein
MRTAVRNTRRDIDSTMSITPQENCATEFVPENARHALNEKGDPRSGTWGANFCDTTRGVSTRNLRVESRERDPNVSGVNLTSKDKKVESQSIGKEKKDPNPKDITRGDNNVGP